MDSENNNTAIERLRAAGLRPTRQRLALTKLLFNQGNRHVTAEQLHSEARLAAIPVSLATVYNTLHQFTQAGLLKEVVVDPARTYFDTNNGHHHHFHNAATGILQDISDEHVLVVGLPKPPDKYEIESINVIVRVGPSPA